MDNKRVLCYGDSNTWGYIPNTEYNRYNKKERWTAILQELLGEKFEIIEEGLNSRTLISEDTRPGKEGKNGFAYLIPCLDTHDPIDLVVLMLGTNELKQMYNKSAKEIGEMLEEYFVKTILNRKSQFRATTPKLLIISPPSVNENKEYSKDKYKGANEKSKQLSQIYKDIADKYNCYFIDTTDLNVGEDGVHMTKDSHVELANRINKKIINIL